MRHIKIKGPSKGHKYDALIASISSNSFGDQIVSFRKFGSKKEACGLTSWDYEEIEQNSYPEGNHLSDREIITIGKKIFEKSTKVF